MKNCLNCGKEIPQNALSARKLFCSDRCKEEDYTKRRSYELDMKHRQKEVTEELKLLDLIEKKLEREKELACKEFEVLEMKKQILAIREMNLDYKPKYKPKIE